MHDGSSPAGRERPSSMQGMDMASLPPRKRPWQDGPGTGDHREMEPPCADGGERTGHCWTTRTTPGAIPLGGGPQGLPPVETHLRTCTGAALPASHRQGLGVCDRCLEQVSCRHLLVLVNPSLVQVPGLSCFRGLAATGAGVNSCDS